MLPAAFFKLLLMKLNDPSNLSSTPRPANLSTTIFYVTIKININCLLFSANPFLMSGVLKLNDINDHKILGPSIEFPQYCNILQVSESLLIQVVVELQNCQSNTFCQHFKTLPSSDFHFPMSSNQIKSNLLKAEGPGGH